MGASTSKTGRDSIHETENHAEEFGSKHVTEKSSGFHPSLIELHAPSAGIGILIVVGFLCLAAVIYKSVAKYLRHTSRHRALRHYYHLAEANNFRAPLYPQEPRMDDYEAAQARFVRSGPQMVKHQSSPVIQEVEPDHHASRSPQQSQEMVLREEYV